MTERFTYEEALRPAPATGRFSYEDALPPARPPAAPIPFDVQGATQAPLSFGPGTEAAHLRQFDDRETIRAADPNDGRLAPYESALVRALQASPSPPVQSHVAGIVRERTGGAGPDPFYEQSFAARNVVNPLNVGVSRLQQGAGAGGASTRVELMRMFNSVDELVRQGDPQAALDFARSANMPEVGQYAVAVAQGAADQAAAIRQRTGAEFMANINDVTAAQERIADIPQDPQLASALQSGDIGELVSAIARDPGIITRVGLESLPIMAPGLLATPAVGAVAGLGANSLLMERNLSMLESLREVAAPEGGEVSAERLAEVFQDPASLTAARQRALRRGVPIALFDAFSAGLASRMIPMGLTSRAGRESANLAAQTGAQGAAGAAGEAAAQVASGQPINPAEIALEGVAEFAGAPVEVAGIAAGGARTAAPDVQAVRAILEQDPDALRSAIDRMASEPGGVPPVYTENLERMESEATPVEPRRPGNEWTELYDDSDPPQQIGWFNRRTRETRPMDGAAPDEENVSRETAGRGLSAAPGSAPAATPAPEQRAPSDLSSLEATGPAALANQTPAPSAPAPQPAALPAPAATVEPENAPASVAAPESDTAPIGRSGDVVPLPVSSLVVDPETFQFKETDDAEGVTERLRSVERFDPFRAGTILVFEAADGTRFVADGHQRTGLARRISQRTGQDIEINAQIVREADGYTAADVRGIAALRNLAEGSGTPIDAAKIFRAGVSPEDIANLPRAGREGAVVRDGLALSQLGDDAFGMVVNGVVPANYAAIVGDRISDPTQQVEALRVLSQAQPGNANQARLIVDQINAAGFEQSTQETLFGDVNVSESLIAERARILDNMRRQQRQLRGVFKTLVTETETIEGAGNKLDRAANWERLSENERFQQQLEAVERLATRRGPVSDALAAAATSLKRDGNLASATSGFVSAVRGQLAQGLSGLQQDAAPAQSTEPDLAATGEGSLFQRGDIPGVSRRYAAERDEVVSRIFQVAKATFGTKLNVGVFNRLTDGRGNEVFGAFDKRQVPGGPSEYFVAVSLSERSPNPLATLNHEGIHYLREAGAFTPQQWDMLTRQAAKKWRREFNIDRRYKRAEGQTREAWDAMATEEAIAEAYGAYASGRMSAGPAKGIFRMIQRFLGRIANMLRGMGFRSWQDVFEDIEAGAMRQDVESGSTEGADATRYQRGMMLDLPDQGVIDALTDGNLSLTEKLRSGVSASALRVSTDNVRTKMQDRFLPLKRIQDAIAVAEGKPLAEAHNAYLAEEGYSSRAGERLLQIKRRFKDPLLEKIRASGLSIAKVDDYLYARHAPERNAQIARINPKFRGPDNPGSGMSNAEAAAIISKARASGDLEALEDIAQMFDEMNAHGLDTRVELGLLSEEDAAAWRETYPNYAPLRGQGDLETQPRRGRGYTVSGNESERALGRSSKAQDILSHAIMQVEEAAIRGEKNHVGQALLNLAQNHPYPELWSVNPVEQRAVLSSRTGLVEYRDAAPMGVEEQERTIRVKVGGEPVKIRLENARLARALQNLDVEQMRGVMGLAAGLNRYLSLVNTGLNPNFIITNALRDIQAGMVNLAQFDVPKFKRSVLRDYPKALKASFGGVQGADRTAWQKHFRDYAAAGGKVSFFRLDDVQSQRTDLERELRRMSQSRGDPRRIIRGFFKGVELTNQAVDNAIRLSAFVNARDAGMSARHAASIAKNLTVNFNRRGEIGQQMNALYLFYNAGVQGTAVIMGAMRSKKVRRLVYGMVATGFVMELLNGMLSPEEDDGTQTYDRISDFEKSRNLILALPGGTYIRVPMPYGYNAFYDLGRNMAAYARGAQTAGHSINNVLTTAVDAFNPVGGAQSIAALISPTFTDPIVDLATNEDFAGRPIRPERQRETEHTPDSQLYWSNVSPVSRAVAEELNALTGGNAFRAGAIDISPESMDHMFGFFTGAAGSFVQRTFVDLPTRLLNGEPVYTQDVPLFGVVVRQVGPWASRGEFYDRRDMIEQAYHEVRGLASTGEGEAARGALDEQRAILRMRPLAQQTQQALTEIRRRREAAEASGASAESLERLDDAEQRVLNQFNGQWLRTVTLPQRNF